MLLTKNLCVYKLVEDIKVNYEELNTALSEYAYKPCHKTQKESYGFVPPSPLSSDILVYEQMGKSQLYFRHEKKKLPAKSVNEAVMKREVEFKQKEGRDFHKAERKQVRDDVEASMLATAPCVSDYFSVIIYKREKLILVEASSFKNAELILSTLRSALGSLKVVPIALPAHGTDILTSWIRDPSIIPSESQFTIGSTATLKEPGGGKISCSKLEALSDDVQELINSGKIAIDLELNWADTYNFRLTSDLQIKQVKAGAEFYVKQEEGEDPAQRYDNDFALITSTLLSLAHTVIDVMGCLKEADEDKQAA